MIRSKRPLHRPIPPQQPGPLDFRSDQIRERLSRIGDHYSQLEELLQALELKLPASSAESTVTPLPRKPR